MNRFAVALLFLPLPSVAEDPFSCVDPNIRDAFLPGYPTPSRYSIEVPDDFVTYSVPSGFELIGSQVNDSSTAVVYSARSDVGAAIDEIARSLEENGWQSIDDVTTVAGRGFQSTSIPRFRRLCRDSGPGLLTVSTREVSGSSLVSITVSSAGNLQSCGDLAVGDRRVMHYMSLAKEIPNLKLPDGVRSTNTGSGGGGDEYETSAVVSTEMGRESLVSFLNDQIRDQGWNFDDAWSGSRSSGSSWFKDSADGDLIIGVLHAYGASENTFNLQFSINLSNTDRQTGTSAIGIYPQ